MGTIIVLSDIHGNLEALESTWRDLQGRRYEALYCLGDLAAFGPWPEECVAMIRDVIRPTATILGNTDRYILEQSWKGADKSPVQDALSWTRKQLSKASLEWLGSLPATARDTIDGLDIELIHGAPGDDETGLGPQTPSSTLEEYFADAGPGVTFSGHTHIPWRGRVGKRDLINAGSVGFPFDGDHRSAYVRMHVGDGRVHDVDFRRVVFNADRVIRALEAEQVPMRDISSRRLRFAEAEFSTVLAS